MPYLHTIEPIAQASAPMRALVDRLGPAAMAYAMIRLPYSPREMKGQPDPSRDRTDEMTQMLRGLAGNLDAEVWTHEFTGRELYELGFEVVGSAFIYTYRLLLV